MIRDPWHRNKLIRNGILSAIYEEMNTNPRIFILGEGAHMKIHFDAPQIETKFPERILTLPISEDGNSNFAVGMALAGLIPIVDVISSDFLFRTMDAICNTMAKLGTVQQPRTIIVRAEFLTGGPTSGQRIEAMFTHVPGLRVVIPSNPTDAYNAMTTALNLPEITIFFEDRMIKDEWFDEPLPSLTPHKSEDSTVISYGITNVLARRALKEKNCAIYDLPTLSPLDLSRVFPSALWTKKVLVIEPDATFMGIGAEIVAHLAERVPGCKFRRLGAPRMTIPASRELHDRMLPTEADILAAHEELMS